LGDEILSLFAQVISGENGTPACKL
jgi:chromosome segregation ATPase